VFNVNNIKKCHSASLITTAENGDMKVNRQLLNNVTTVYTADNVCCSSETMKVAELWLLLLLL